jgi:hypothetical protein
MMPKGSSERQCKYVDGLHQDLLVSAIDVKLEATDTTSQVGRRHCTGG